VVKHNGGVESALQTHLLTFPYKVHVPPLLQLSFRPQNLGEGGTAPAVGINATILAFAKAASAYLSLI
jgi:hypothetical protein